jgi:hypothetical protein
MLHFLGDSPGARKLRLFAVAYCENVQHWLEDERARAAVKVAEEFADGLATPEEFAIAFAAAEAAFYDTARRVGSGDPTFPVDAVLAYFAAYGAIDPEAGFAACTAAAMSAAPSLWAKSAEETRRQCALVREVFGDRLGQPRAIDPCWLTCEVIIRAHAMYDRRDFSRMPDLADLLEASGCRDPEIIGHCRGLGPHVRGCWVIDLLLGKE